MSKKPKKKIISVGGQALMEGILMRGPAGSAISLRLPDGSIETYMKDFRQLKDKYKFFRIPLIRGITSFIESMITGYKCLMESAEKTSMDITDEEPESKLDKWLTKHFGPKMMAVIGVISMILGVALAFALFFWLPSFLFDLLNGAVKGSLSFWRPAFEGLLRIIIFVSYMVVVSKMKEIHRLFMYHGAEHKSIACFESGEELTVENVKKQKRFHPRCGTSFIFVMIILSILISFLVSMAWPQLTENRAIWMAVKVLMMPVIMGIGYEFIRYAGAHNNIITKIFSAPGLWMQRITTKEPLDDIIEVGICAIKASLGIVEDDPVPAEYDSVTETENIEQEASENDIS